MHNMRYLSYKNALKRVEQWFVSTDGTSDKLDNPEIWLRRWIIGSTVFTVLVEGEQFVFEDSLEKRLALPKYVAYNDPDRYFISRIEEIPQPLALPVSDANIFINGLNTRSEFTYVRDQLSESLEKPGVFPLLNDPFCVIDCCGAYVEVDHTPQGDVMWRSTCPQGSLKYRSNFLVGTWLGKKNVDGDYELDDLTTSQKEDGVRVLAPFPIYFSKTDLSVLTKKKDLFREGHFTDPLM